MHLTNVIFCIRVKPLPSVTLSSRVHPAKAMGLIVCTLSGIFIDFNILQLQNAFLPIDKRLSGRLIPVMLQLINASSAITVTGFPQ